MSAATETDALAARVEALEAAIAPPQPAGASPSPSSSSAAEVARLAKALARAEYRILHLARGLELATQRAERAEAQLAAAHK